MIHFLEILYTRVLVVVVEFIKYRTVLSKRSSSNHHGYNTRSECVAGVISIDRSHRDLSATTY
jgi:hypothetical protein